MNFPFRRDKNTHKGDYGKIAIIAGSYGMAGAAILCANSCMRSGAGLTYLLVPDSIYDVVASKCVCTVIIPLKTKNKQLTSDNVKIIADFCNSKADAVCLGPGISQSSELRKLINMLIARLVKPLVLDADGLNLLDISLLKKRKHPTIITPHAGEFARLTNTKTKPEQFSKDHNVILVLKGNKTLVTDGSKVYKNTSGNPGMATGGSGDCLTGIIGALLATVKSPFEAACFGVYIHGLAGDFASQKLSETSMCATDIIDYLPKAFINAQKKCTLRVLPK